MDVHVGATERNDDASDLQMDASCVDGRGASTFVRASSAFRDAPSRDSL